MRLIVHTFVLALFFLLSPRTSEGQQYETRTAYVIRVEPVAAHWTVVLLYQNQAYPVLVGPSDSQPYRRGEWVAVDVIQYDYGVQLRLRNPRTTR